VETPVPLGDTGHVNPDSKRRAQLKIVVLLVVAVLFPGFSIWASDPLFGSDGALSLTIRGPLMSLTRATVDNADVSGWIEFGDGGQIPVTFSRFGVSRLEQCDVPSLVITVDPKSVLNTPFEGQRKLWLVTPCRHTSGYQKFILLEYLVYKCYAVIAAPALQVRLVNLRYRDSERLSVDETEYAFLVEDIGEAADRHGKEWLDIRKQPFKGLDPAQLSRLALFQFMVGNTDWSALSIGANERCCHNIAILGSKDGSTNTVLPFDFDQAGLVNAPYAFPDPSLMIRDVTHRVYRGYCLHNDYLPEAIAAFNEMRAEIEALFNQELLPFSQVRMRALKYVEGFYDTINDPKKLKKQIVNKCR
jgi:hypothetical protein